MRVVEVSGGIFTMLPSTEYKFLKRLIDNNKYAINSSDLTEKQLHICNSLVEYHILDKEENYYYIREVYL